MEEGSVGSDFYVIPASASTASGASAGSIVIPEGSLRGVHELAAASETELEAVWRPLRAANPDYEAKKVIANELGAQDASDDSPSLQLVVESGAGKKHLAKTMRKMHTARRAAREKVTEKECGERGELLLSLGDRLSGCTPVQEEKQVIRSKFTKLHGKYRAPMVETKKKEKVMQDFRELKDRHECLKSRCHVMESEIARFSRRPLSADCASRMRVAKLQNEKLTAKVIKHERSLEDMRRELMQSIDQNTELRVKLEEKSQS